MKPNGAIAPAYRQICYLLRASPGRVGAVHPAKLQGLRQEQVINLAVHSGSFWDALFMMRRGGGLPDSVDRAVIEIGPVMFNQNSVNPVLKKRHFPPAHFVRWAGLMSPPPLSLRSITSFSTGLASTKEVRRAENSARLSPDSVELVIAL